jgi:hypothetical protein
MKVTVKKIQEVNASFFSVYENERLIQCFVFNPEILDEKEIQSEVSAYNRAMQLVKKIEASNGERIEEIIYQTK